MKLEISPPFIIPKNVRPKAKTQPIIIVIFKDTLYLTKLGGKQFLLNEEQIESVSQSPDTIIVLSNGRKMSDRRLRPSL